MATYTWEYGEEGSGLHFTIVYDTIAGTFTVKSLEGKFDLNALWWNDGIDDGSGVSLSKQDNSLNMNGSGEDWDGMAKLSSAGLGKEGEDKDSFISDGETAVFTLADFGITGEFDVENGGTLGVRATSVNGGDSIKLVDDDPVFFDPGNEPDPDNFPEWSDPGLSHVTFYFETGIDPHYSGDDSGIVGDKGANDPDGWFTVKFDDETIDELSAGTNDLDEWFDAAMAFIAANYPTLDMTTLEGVSIKGGTQELWYEIDGEPNDDDSPEAPDVWIVENKEVDVSHTVTWDGTDYTFV